MGDEHLQNPQGSGPSPDLTEVLGCPRCGHDIRASCALARARGDATVLCTECGLDSAIAQLDAGEGGPTWFLESPFSPKSRVRRAIETYGRAHLPHRFWRSVPMTVRLRPWRFALIFLIAALLGHVIAVGFKLAHSEVVPRGVGGRPPAESVTAQIAHALVFPTSAYAGSQFLFAAVLANPDREVDASALGRFVVLSGTYGLPTAGWDAAVPYAPRRTRSLEGANAFVMEEESGFRSTYVDLQGVSVIGTISMFPSDVELSFTIIAFGLMSLCLTAVPMVAVLMLMLLPWTLRRSKVRFVHLARAAAYAAVLFPVVLLMTGLMLTFGSQPGSSVQVLALLATFAFTMLWIDAVCRRYLRIPHALGTAFLLSIAAILCIFAVAVGVSSLV